MKNIPLSLLLLLCGLTLSAQSNEYFTHAGKADFLLGNFDPADYIPAEVIDNPYNISEQLLTEMSADSLRRYLEEMSVFGNRNTASDTVSTTFGMGAARRWAFERMQGFSDRLHLSYLEFDQNVCGLTDKHRNVVAILPGTGPQYDEVILLEGHFDSRCEDACDVTCIAHGMEDNGSGSALVMEAARVMSRFTFNRTLVFMLTTGEEQGLYGGQAMANWCQDNDVKLKAVLNNDITGGVICGETASPPGCPGLNEVDSINVRVYSAGGVGSGSRMFARYAKLEYTENIRDLMPVQTVMNLMTQEDRTGRGGDHIPFRQKGYPAIRFTSANEHGDGNPAQGDYHDRQHSDGDLLGEDTDGDGVLDSFFVDFNYLLRNTIINANAATAAAASPLPPENMELETVPQGFRITFDDSEDYGMYRIGLRKYSNADFDTLVTVTATDNIVTGLEEGAVYVASVCTVDALGIESLFVGEKFNFFNTVNAVTPALPRPQPVELLQNYPNPFDEATMIGVVVSETFPYREAHILITDLNGKQLTTLPITLNLGMNEVVYGYEHHQYIQGTYIYSLVADGKVIASKQMVYAY